MSSLAAAQADGYYLPVEYYESGAYKKQSKNQWNDKQQGKPKPTGPPVVRFELPLTGTCAGCGHFILRGTRYNAEKTKAGMYFTSTIWEFKIKCRNCCKQVFILRTNPKDQTFDYVSGIIKQQRNLEPTPTPRGDGGDSSEEEKDFLSQLETMAKGKRKVMTERDQLESMQKSSTSLYLNDASRNAAVRAKFRVERKDRKRQRKDAEALGYREGISILDRSLEDEVGAKEVTYGNRHAAERKSFGKARASSIFSSEKKKVFKQSAKRKKNRRPKDPIQPDRVLSSREGTKATKEDAPSVPKKKKVLVVGMGKAKAAESGLGALMDYGSDSS